MDAPTNLFTLVIKICISINFWDVIRQNSGAF